VKPERLVAVALTVSILSGVGVAVVYVAGGQPQAEGVLLFLALAGIGTALIVWGKRLTRPEQIVEDRELPSAPAERDAAAEALERGGEDIGRRRFLARLLAGALGALGLAALFPIRSLGPSPGRSLLRTSWRRGLRVVDESGQPVSVADLEIGSVITVFPEGHVGSADSQTLLIRVEPDLLELSPDRRAWAPDGLVAYSKVCTHAGCPVGLYRATTRELLCPCHQSTFDVLQGATPVFGPASRPLPQLPLEVDEEGYLRARSDFPEPVGPAFWNRPEGDDG
jgi:ubiquinol-cytochrome c reductase iron-sulfur subunit